MTKFITILFFFCLTATLEAQEIGVTVDEQPWPQSMQSKLDSLIANDPLLETSQLGLMVYDLTADSALYQYQHRQTMRPASTMKLVTAIASLDRLGGDYQLKTRLYYTGEVIDSTLWGSLYLVGGMDPMFDVNDLRNFAERVRQLGIRSLRGSIVTDRSMKDELELGEGWCWDDDNPKLTPLLVERRADFLDRMVTELSAVGIRLDSVTTFEERPPLDAIQLAECRHSIDELLLRMMKDSDNLYAECLYYQLAASFGHQPARAAHARALEKQLVKQIGLDSGRYRFADGSGLSLYNYVSPELLTMLLRYAWQEIRIYNHLAPSLPVAGMDGTLKKRMRKTAAEGNVRAKTGTLTGIISLAGYLTAANGHELCFAIINQGVLSAREARSFQDRLCVLMCE
jgi:D-alanyl-D-alanine carboxypeptidase/D-alanyl-D-alanine-endopeptidase (penicillin-binding protein 4)